MDLIRATYVHLRECSPSSQAATAQLPCHERRDAHRAADVGLTASGRLALEQEVSANAIYRSHSPDWCSSRARGTALAKRARMSHAQVQLTGGAPPRAS